MKNRRVFKRADCSIPVVVHERGKFLYGEVVDLSLGGVRLSLKKRVKAEQVELTPDGKLPEGLVVIPLPYSLAWQDGAEKPEAGLQFAGGTNAFFRGWLAEHLGPLLQSPDALLDHRRVVRVPCQLEAEARVDEEEFACAVLDLSVGGASFIVPREAFPGETLEVTFLEAPELGTVEAILLRVQSLQGHSLCGGKFLEPSPEQEKILEQLVLEMSRTDRLVSLD